MITVDKNLKETYNQTNNSVASDLRVRQLTFVEGINAGMNPSNALKRCPPSEYKDITIKVIKTCITAGLTTIDIAKGFSVKPHTIYQFCSQNQIKLGKKTLSEEQKSSTEEFSAELITGDVVNYNKEIGESNDVCICDSPPVLDQFYESLSEAIEKISDEIEAEANQDEYVNTFGIISDNNYVLPRIRIRKNGLIVISGCDLNLNERYIFRTTKDFKKIQLIIHEKGFKPRKHTNRNSIEISCAAMIKNIINNLDLPLTYKFDIQTLTGELVNPS